MPPPLAFDEDLHIHTVYSGHSAADMLVPSICERARALGLARVAILEHVPEISPATAGRIDLWRARRDDRTAIDAILDDVERVRPHFPELEVLVGAEIDADPDALDGSLMLADRSGVDLVVASLHVLPGGRSFWFEPDEDSHGPVDEAAVAEWFAWAERVVRVSRPDVLAHPGSPLVAHGWPDAFGEDVLARFDPLLDAMRETGCAFELNELVTSKLGAALAAGYARLLARARERCVRFTIGSDAHRLDFVGEFAWAYEAAEAAGLAPEDFVSPKRREPA